MNNECQISEKRVILENRLFLIYRYLTCEFLYLQPQLSFEDNSLYIALNGNLGDRINVSVHHSGSGIVVVSALIPVDETSRIVQLILKKIIEVENIPLKDLLHKEGK
jgi:hypothetical protein